MKREQANHLLKLLLILLLITPFHCVWRAKSQQSTVRVQTASPLLVSSSYWSSSTLTTLTDDCCQQDWFNCLTDWTSNKWIHSTRYNVCEMLTLCDLSSMCSLSLCCWCCVSYFYSLLHFNFQITPIPLLLYSVCVCVLVCVFCFSFKLATRDKSRERWGLFFHSSFSLVIYFYVSLPCSFDRQAITQVN